MSDKPSAKRYLTERRWEKNRAKRVAKFEKMLAESRTEKSQERHQRAKIRNIKRRNARRAGSPGPGGTV